MQQYDNTGVEFDSFKAPWRQKDQAEEEFECLCSQTLSKTSTVFTNDYTPLYEDGNSYCETGNTDWKEAYHENEHYTPSQLLGLFKNCLQSMLGNGMFPSSRSYLNHLIEECSGWCEDETEYMEG